MNKTRQMTYGALISAVYVCLSLMPPFNAFSYGPVQFRVAEALMLTALVSPHYAASLSIGCFVANLFAPYGANVFDLVFGTSATVVAAIVTYALRKFFTKNKLTILLSPLPTILANALIVGSYLPYLTGTGTNVISVAYCMGSVALGEIGVLYIIGIPLYHIIKKKKIVK